MARGFESKSVADQQEAALQEAPERPETPDASVAPRRKKLELARADVLRQMDTARAEGHKVVLKRALEALDKELSKA